MLVGAFGIIGFLPEMTDHCDGREDKHHSDDTSHP
jgi:hypothetical protein